MTHRIYLGVWRYAALTKSSLISWGNNGTNGRTVDPGPENGGASWCRGPVKLEVVKSCVVFFVLFGSVSYREQVQYSSCYKFPKHWQQLNRPRHCGKFVVVCVCGNRYESTLPLCIPYINQNQVQRINSVVSIFSSAGGKSLHLTTVHCPCEDMWSLKGKEIFFQVDGIGAHTSHIWRQPYRCSALTNWAWTRSSLNFFRLFLRSF